MINWFYWLIILKKCRGRGRGRWRPIASEVLAPAAIRGRRAAAIINPIIAPEVVVRGGRSRGRQIVVEAQASEAPVETPAPAVVLQFKARKVFKTDSTINSKHLTIKSKHEIKTLIFF